MAKQISLFEDDETKIYICCKSKSELYYEYKGKSSLSRGTFNKWLHKLPFYEEIKAICILPPIYVKQVYDHLGEP